MAAAAHRRADADSRDPGREGNVGVGRAGAVDRLRVKQPGVKPVFRSWDICTGPLPTITNGQKVMANDSDSFTWTTRHSSVSSKIPATGIVT